MNPHETTREFERALCEYTGAKYAVTTNSCTNALLIACAWHEHTHGSCILNIPRYTYVSVPQSIMTAGHVVSFRDEDWLGEYQLNPSPIWDSARRFTSGMYRPGSMQCVSFHISKILGLDQGGAVLHDNDEADVWLRRARFDGRATDVEPKHDTFTRGFHCYLSPTISAQGLWRLSFLPKDNPDLPNSDYPDLSKVPLFQLPVERSEAIWHHASLQNSPVIMGGVSRGLSGSFWQPRTRAQTP
jgi:dTDP-4-amino-4,6-dideoxygalactose transaminase